MIKYEAQEEAVWNDNDENFVLNPLDDSPEKELARNIQKRIQLLDEEADNAAKEIDRLEMEDHYEKTAVHISRLNVRIDAIDKEIEELNNQLDSRGLLRFFLSD